MKNIVLEAGRTSQRGDHQHLNSVAWQPPACHGVIGEKTYMGANNPLSGALKGALPAEHSKVEGKNKAHQMEKPVWSSRTSKYSR